MQARSHSTPPPRPPSCESSVCPSFLPSFSCFALPPSSLRYATRACVHGAPSASPSTYPSRPIPFPPVLSDPLTRSSHPSSFVVPRSFPRVQVASACPSQLPRQRTSTRLISFPLYMCRLRRSYAAHRVTAYRICAYCVFAPSLLFRSSRSFFRCSRVGCPCPRPFVCHPAQQVPVIRLVVHLRDGRACAPLPMSLPCACGARLVCR